MSKLEIEYCNNCGSSNIKFPEDLNMCICLDCEYITYLALYSRPCDKLSLLIWKKFYKDKKIIGNNNG